MDLLQELSTGLAREPVLRARMAQLAVDFETALKRVQSLKAEGFRLMDEREAFNMVMAADVQRNRYTDMIFRMGRDETLTKYQDAFENAVRYTWLAAKAYDYETSLSEGAPAAATTFLESLVKTRQLGLWEAGEPRIGQGGLAGVLARMNGNFETLKGQLGINNPQQEIGKLSLRHGHFRIARGNPTSDKRWVRALKGTRVDDLMALPEFRKHCRPFAPDDGTPQPGLVIDFSTEINAAKNVFGRELGGEDHAYSSANFATKIRSVGIWFEGYNESGLSGSPRVYLVPVGADVLRISDGENADVRTWNVVEQRIPVPFVINEANLLDNSFIPSIDSLNGSFTDVRRHGDFRAYHTGPGEAVDPAQMTTSSRLIGRSAWNTQWLLIIPGVTLHADSEFGLNAFSESVSDIELMFKTYSHEGM